MGHGRFVDYVDLKFLVSIIKPAMLRDNEGLFSYFMNSVGHNCGESFGLQCSFCSFKFCFFLLRLADRIHLDSTLTRVILSDLKLNLPHPAPVFVCLASFVAMVGYSAIAF